MTREELIADLGGRFTIITGPRGPHTQDGTPYQSIKGGPYQSKEEAIADWKAMFDTAVAGKTGELHWQEPPRFEKLSEAKAFSERPVGWYSYARCVVIQSKNAA